MRSGQSSAQGSFMNERSPRNRRPPTALCKRCWPSPLAQQTGAMSATSPTSLTWEGWSYLATVIDLASRRVVGWALADHMRTELTEDALKMAFAQRGPEKGVIFHSDRGQSVHKL